MTRGQSPESSSNSVSAKRFCGLLDICVNPLPDLEQPLSPPTSANIPPEAFSSKPAADSQDCGIEHEQQQTDQQTKWPCSPAALSKKLASCRRRKCLVLQLLAALVIVLCFTWPWILPGLVWGCGITSWVVPGPEVDPVSFEVADPEAVNRYPVPRIIHQTWKTSEVPEKWQAAQRSCKDLHPDWEYRLWTDSDAVTFIKEHYPHLQASFEAYPYNIERADAIRYLILHHHGGIYIDLDIVCLRSLDFLRAYDFVMPQTMPVGFSNDFLVGRKRHPFLEQLVAALPRWSMRLGNKYPTVMFSTGPMFVTLQATFFRARKSLSVLPFSLYGKYTSKAANPLLRHLYGSSWHSSDARSIFWMIKHPVVLGSTLTLLLVGSLAAIVWRRFNHTRNPSDFPQRSRRAQIIALAESFKLT